ncbi:serine protease 52-like [Oppia nitens]|uniref:serine protease 52-like n=1 Tax=Oppia nitens TaxID=1686743 RepID=UPI0023DCD710|nr:serine protease 52-like [Oppia nitens]
MLITICSLAIDMSDQTVGYNNNNNTINTNNNNSINDFRVSGSNTKVVYQYQVPWVVSIRNWKNGDLICGGVIVDKYWLLTSAQCIADRSEASMYISSGSSDLKTIKHKNNVDKFVLPNGASRTKLPESQVNQLTNNIAMIKIKSPGFDFKDSVKVKQAKLFPDTNMQGKKLYVYGWGKPTNVMGKEIYQNQLEMTKSNVFAESYCNIKKQSKNLILFELYRCYICKFFLNT